MTKNVRSYRSRQAFFVFTLIGLIYACTGSASPQDEEHELNTNMPPAFTTPVVELTLPHDKTILFGIKACKVYRLVRLGNTPKTWELLFKPAPYFLPQRCVREHLEFDGEYVQIEIGTQAMGAGGCCTNYAAYRSRNGENWEIRRATSIKEWQMLDASN